MPYTRIWADVNNLQGSRDADEIDNASRETHTDLTERFGDILADVNADPWRLKGVGPTTRYLWSAGTVRPFTGTTVGYSSLGDAVSPVEIGIPVHTVLIYMPIPVSAGGKLLEVKFRFSRFDTTTIANGSVFKISAGGVTANIGSPVVAAVGSFANYSTGPLSAVVANGETVYALVELTNGLVLGAYAWFMDMEVTVG